MSAVGFPVGGVAVGLGGGIEVVAEVRVADSRERVLAGSGVQHVAVTPSRAVVAVAGAQPVDL